MAAEVSPARKWLRRLGALVVFGFNGAVAVAILIFGTTFLQQRASATPTVEAAPLPKVAVMRLDRSESYDLTRRFIGQVEATRSTDLAFERGGTVAEVLVEEGESVVAGEIVATLDIRSLEATIARHEATRRALESDRELAVLTRDRHPEAGLCYGIGQHKLHRLAKGRGGVGGKFKEDRHRPRRRIDVRTDVRERAPKLLTVEHD